MSKTTKADDATPADDPGPAPADSPNALPDYVLDAIELPSLQRWVFNTPGDYAAGALVRYGTRDIDALDGNSRRTIPVIIMHGATIATDKATGELYTSEVGYVEVAGFGTVLERQLSLLRDAEVGTLVRVQYTGHVPSPTKGHSDYADFDITIGRRTDQVPTDIITGAPDIREPSPIDGTAELTQGEPF